MASIVNDPGGKKRIQFVDPHGDRKAIRLGKKSKSSAERMKCRVEHLLEAILLNRPMDSELATWVSGLDPRMAKKLAAVGLIPKPQTSSPATLDAFLTEYIAGRTDVKPLTTRHLNDAKRNLIAFFGAEKPLAEITPGDADDFRRNLLQRLGENTVRRQCGRAKQFFRAALRKRLIPENPFGDMKGCGVQPNRSRDYFVSRQDAAKVLDHCPDAQWRLIFALSRFGGLRCPSEHLALRWEDVDWERDRIRVRSPKTEHHEGGEYRWIPIFPELRPYLDEVWAEPGPAEYVITRYRTANANLRTQLERIIRRAGLDPWPKLFHNLRATRETELAQTFPLHVVCAWIGNSQTVAAKHYLQVTEDHFRDALTQVPKVAQKEAQHLHATKRNVSHALTPAQKETPENPGFAIPGDIMHTCSVPPDGLEPSTL